MFQVSRKTRVCENLNTYLWLRLKSKDKVYGPLATLCKIIFKKVKDKQRTNTIKKQNIT